MLTSLHVKNLALIDETEVTFGSGLNILSGETGAGKSIIIGSVNLALGAKADKDMIRTGAEYALVELVFTTDDTLRKQIMELELPVEEDGSVIIQRKIMPQKSVLKICGETVTAKQMKDLADLLIDIHGQHQHQSLLNKKKHLEILDDFSGEKLFRLKSEIKVHYQKYHEYQKEYETTQLDENARTREISLAEYEVKEIENANLKAEEDTDLETTYKKMLYAKKIIETMSYVYALTGYEGKESAGETISRALREMKSVVHYDNLLEDKEKQLEEIETLLVDFNREIASYLEDMDFTQADFDQMEERLNVINRLKSKYGSTLDEIRTYQKQQQEKLEQLENYEIYRENLEKQAALEKELCVSLCKTASDIRSKNAVELTNLLKEALEDLNFINVTFEIQVRPETENISANGYDDVEFMISTNPGEPIKSLSNVASGGELSRIMLALKTVLADKDLIDTLIFDEIDTGISGKTAWKVSEKMAVLSRKHQLICITHLPQIAAMADNHFVIEKSVIENKTVTTIKELDEETVIDELSRMLGGVEITDNVRNNAKEMKTLASKTKHLNLK